MSFAIGEVVTLQNIVADSDWNGREVTIISEPVPARLWLPDGSSCGVYMAYQVAAPWLPFSAMGWGFVAYQLRKRRPPPDWKSLAGVKDKPLELEPA